MDVLKILHVAHVAHIVHIANTLELIHIIDNYEYKAELKIDGVRLPIPLREDILRCFADIVSGSDFCDIMDGPLQIYIADDDEPVGLHFCIDAIGDLTILHIWSDDLPIILAQILHAHYFLRDLATDLATDFATASEKTVVDYVKGKIHGKLIPADEAKIEVRHGFCQKIELHKQMVA